MQNQLITNKLKTAQSIVQMILPNVNTNVHLILLNFVAYKHDARIQIITTIMICSLIQNGLFKITRARIVPIILRRLETRLRGYTAM